MKWLWDHYLDVLWLMLFQRVMKSNGLKIALQNWSLCTNNKLIFLFFSSQPEDLLIFWNYHSSEYPNIIFSFESKLKKMSFLNPKVSGENERFKTIVHRKATFISVPSHFYNFLPTTYEFSVIYTLAYRYFKYSNLTLLDNELH